MKTSDIIRAATREDHAAIINVAKQTGLFQPSELTEFDGMISAFFDGELDDHHWWVFEAEEIVGAAYYAPEAMTQGTWNLYFIGFLPAYQGGGRGAALLSKVEENLRQQGARVLIVETSGVSHFALTREFYRKQGYDEEARIRDFYAAGDDKVVFWKSLASSPL